MFKRPLITTMFTADPSVHVFDGKLYLYPSHDLDHQEPENDNGDQYKMEDYHVFSMDDPEGLVTDHGEVLHVKKVPWASCQMWAPDAAYRDGKYYFYFPARDKEGIFRIGVATGKRPGGPFKPERNYIKGSFSIDPCVLTDDDGSAWMAFGGLWGGQLQDWTTGKFIKGSPHLSAEQVALCPKLAPLADDMLSFKESPQDIVIQDANGKPLLAGDTTKRYFEGPCLHKYQGTYYLSYSTGDTHLLVYATAKNIRGPYTFQGTIMTPPVGWTTHHYIVEYKGKWYLFYHDSSMAHGVSHKRCVKVQELKYNADGSIVCMEP